MFKRNLAALVLGAVVLGGGAFAWAQTSDSSSSAPTTTAPNAQQAPTQQGRNGNRPRAGILRRVVHGDLTVRAKDGFEKVAYDRGKEDGVSGDTLTITRPDDTKVSVKLTSDTKYRGVDSASQLQAGRPTIVMSKDSNALVVGQRAGGGGTGGQGAQT